MRSARHNSMSKTTMTRRSSLLTIQIKLKTSGAVALIATEKGVGLARRTGHAR